MGEEWPEVAHHITKGFGLSNGPRFKERFWEGLCDEQSQRHALERPQLGLPLAPRRPRTRTRDYERRGAVTLFTALDNLESTLISRTEQRHTRVDWLRFFEQIERGARTLAGLLRHFLQKAKSTRVSNRQPSGECSMKWQTKSTVLLALDKLPGGDDLYYFLQRNVTRSLPRSTRRIPEYVANYRRHIEAARSRGIKLNESLLMSFGAGWDLFENLVFYGYGVDRQVVVDIKPLARIDLIDGLVAYLGENPLEGAAPRPFAPLRSDLKTGLLHRYGIDYRAPGDVRAVALASSSVDMIATTNTLEHIPKDAIVEILKECRRLIAPYGVVSMAVDYSDHFAHADPSITVYNFLSIGADKWRRHSVERHFQNRLRHSDYARLFEEAGFQIVTHEPLRPPNWQSLLMRQSIAPEFQGYEAEDLAVVYGYFLLVPA